MILRQPIRLKFGFLAKVGANSGRETWEMREGLIFEASFHPGRGFFRFTVF
jgi:hypothetical protein